MTARGPGAREGITVSPLERAPDTRLNTSHHSDGKTEVQREEPHPRDHTELFLFISEPRTLSLRGRPEQKSLLPGGKGPLGGSPVPELIRTPNKGASFLPHGQRLNLGAPQILSAPAQVSSLFTVVAKGTDLSQTAQAHILVLPLTSY